MNLLNKLPEDLRDTAKAYKHFSNSENMFNDWALDVSRKNEISFEEAAIGCSKGLQTYMKSIAEEYGDQVALDFTTYTGIDSFFSIGDKDERTKH